jgi:hypothetical protein
MPTPRPSPRRLEEEGEEGEVEEEEAVEEVEVRAGM